MARLSRRLDLRVAACLALAVCQSASARPAAPPPLSESAGSSIGYDTVAAARADLRSRPGVVFTIENDWIIATDEAAYTIWSFAPEGYPAYPAVVKRQVIPRPVGSVIAMDVLCEASKQACDDLVRTVARMNGLPLPE